MQQESLFFSLITLGFFGGFIHCVGMCGPFVITQIGNRLEKTSLENFSNFKKLKNLALLPYHLGRITTYSLIGFLCSIFSQNISDVTSFRFLSTSFLIFAALFFLNIFFDYKLTKNLKLLFKPKKNLKKTLKRDGFFKDFMAFLFKNPEGFKGYILGLILGFIPCGLLYGAFLIVASMESPINAAFGMFLFGIATVPSLFLTASGGYIFFKLEISKFRLILKTMALINVVMLLIMAYKSIS